MAEVNTLGRGVVKRGCESPLRRTVNLLAVNGAVIIKTTLKCPSIQEVESYHATATMPKHAYIGRELTGV
jgi:hypothetical protein